MRWPSLVLTAMLFLAACGSDNPGGAATVAATSSPDHTPIPPVGAWGTEPVTSEDFPSAAGRIAHLVDVRVAGHDGFDRVVLELAGQDVPSYRVRHVEPPIRRDGSGEVVAVPGEAFLELRLTPASGWDLGGAQPRPTYPGPPRVAGPYTEAITEAVRTADFEATLAWTVGLSHPAPFAVAIYHDPLRLVVDVRHEPPPRSGR